MAHIRLLPRSFALEARMAYTRLLPRSFALGARMARTARRPRASYFGRSRVSRGGVLVVPEGAMNRAPTYAHSGLLSEVVLWLSMSFNDMISAPSPSTNRPGDSNSTW